MTSIVPFSPETTENALDGTTSCLTGFAQTSPYAPRRCRTATEWSFARLQIGSPIQKEVHGCRPIRAAPPTAARQCRLSKAHERDPGIWSKRKSCRHVPENAVLFVSNTLIFSYAPDLREFNVARRGSGPPYLATSAAACPAPRLRDKLQHQGSGLAPLPLGAGSSRWCCSGPRSSPMALGSPDASAWLTRAVAALDLFRALTPGRLCGGSGSVAASMIRCSPARLMSAARLSMSGRVHPSGAGR